MECLVPDMLPQPIFIQPTCLIISMHANYGLRMTSITCSLPLNFSPISPFCLLHSTASLTFVFSWFAPFGDINAACTCREWVLAWWHCLPHRHSIGELVHVLVAPLQILLPNGLGKAPVLGALPSTQEAWMKCLALAWPSAGCEVKQWMEDLFCSLSLKINNQNKSFFFSFC